MIYYYPYKPRIQRKIMHSPLIRVEKELKDYLDENVKGRETYSGTVSRLIGINKKEDNKKWQQKRGVVNVNVKEKWLIL